eukprot:5993432-Pyramimonas_sp.AAC.1
MFACLIFATTVIDLVSARPLREWPFGSEEVVRARGAEVDGDERLGVALVVSAEYDVVDAVEDAEVEFEELPEKEEVGLCMASCWRQSCSGGT